MWVAIHHDPGKPLLVDILTASFAWKKINSVYYIFHLPLQLFTVVFNVDIEPPNCSSSSVCSLVCSETCAAILILSVTVTAVCICILFIF